MRKIIASFLLILLATITIYSQGRGTPSVLRVRTDANNSLITSSIAQVNPTTTTIFNSTRLRTDANGNLIIVNTGGASGATSYAATTCASPGISLTGAGTTGIAFTATPSILLCVNGISSIVTESGGLSVINTGNLIASSVVEGTVANVTGTAGFFGFSGSSIARAASNGKWSFQTNDGTSGLLTEQFTNNPTCATNCGTSPTLDGVDSSFTLTMGATGVPASGFVVTFNGTWPASPQCVSSMALAGMAVGKLVLTIVTTTTTATFVTNGVAPATSDKYHVRCSSGQ